MIIGICGQSGSGKTTFAKNLFNFLKFFNKNLKIIIISMDNFYKGKSKFSEEEMDKFNNNNLNLDAPKMINFNDLLRTIYNIKNGKPFTLPIYGRMKYDIINTYHIYDTYDIIIVEGILVFQNKKLFNLFDIKFYIETRNPIALKRRLNRCDKTIREKKISYYRRFVVPSIKKYIEPYKDKVDFIIDGTKSLEENLNENIIMKIYNKIYEKS